MDKVIDAQNTLIQHLIVGAFSLGLALILNYFLGLGWSSAFGRVSFILLFLTLVIAPLMRFKKPSKSSEPFKSPWCWRGELGIWFVITGIIHAYFAVAGQSLSVVFGQGGHGLANLMGAVALAWGIVLALTSYNKAIRAIGIESWKWLHKFTYVVFYLVAFHLIYFQFFSEFHVKSLGRPDWFGYTAVAMTVLVVALQIAAFLKSVLQEE